MAKKELSEEVEKWQNRKLKKCYPFVYVDCLYCSVKEDYKSIKKAIYVVLGVDTKGIKDVLGIWIDIVVFTNTGFTKKMVYRYF